MAQSRRTAYFISDAHFGIAIEGSENRDRVFCKLMEKVYQTGSDLFIIGDLFDFWIEYKYAIRPDYFLILAQLNRLVNAGVNVYYLAGNHDFALGKFLNETIGIVICPDTLDITLQGKKVHLYHGDGILKKDVGYRILKRLLRNRFNQKLYKMLHPDLGVPFGIFCSGSSRKHSTRLLTPELIREYRTEAFRQLDSGYDIVMYGHTHHGEIVHTHNGKVYCNTGAWLGHYNYVTMEEGELCLWKFSQDGSSKMVPAIDLKTGSSKS